MRAHTCCTDQENVEVLFYEPHDPNGYLSNFASIPVVYKGLIYPTSEHAYQAQKFLNEATRSKIWKAVTPDEAFALSREFAYEVRPDWSSEKEKVMEEVVMEKFRQNTPLATEDRVTRFFFL